MNPKIKVKQNYTPNDVGALLGVHHNTIKNWIKSKNVVAFQTVGGHYRVPRREVVRLIKNRGLSVPEELQGPMGLVYVVDDDELIRRAMDDALSVDYEVYTFNNGFEALMQIGRLKPDLLVLDIYMPGIDGFAMVRKLRQDDKLANLRVIGMSGKVVSQEDARKAGFDEFYEKKQGLKIIVDAVKGYLGTGR
ncbi:MAG: response regulator [bacterium]|nr:response regulator [bacterium]MDT8395679.1 response regulator [bacterium]